MHKHIKQKKIGILTYHFPYNFGAMLQAYALQKKITSLENVNCEIIAYEPPEHINMYVPRIFKTCRITANKKKLFKRIKILMYVLYVFFKEKNHIKRYNFSLFKKYFYKKSHLLKKKVDVAKYIDKTKFDSIIVGSDQIWKKNQKGYDDVYFLNFDSMVAKKYSYAASAGDFFPTNDLPLIKKYLNSFAMISVREHCLSLQLKDYNIENRIDIDPTLLLEKQDYIMIEKKIKNLPQKYIYVYLCRDDNLVEVLTHLYKELKCEIVLGPYVEFKEDFSIKHVLKDYVGPREFLYCIHNASFVVTSSFHCTVFSILYEKPFVVLPGIGKIERIKEFLSYIGLSEHVYHNIEEIDYSFDYTIAHAKIKEKARDSLDYLGSILNA